MPSPTRSPLALRPLSFVLLTALGALGALGGCSSSSSADAPAGPTADQACSDLGATYCSKIDSCASVLTQITYPDVGSCKSTFKANCLLGLSAPSTGATTQQDADCTKAAATVTCSDLFADALPTVCLPVAGTLAEGAACGDDSQCTSKYCSTGDGSVCGKCAVAPVAGASCATQKCAHGLKCSDAKTCVVQGAVGATCDAKSAPCRTELSCTDGKCAPAAGVEGAACDFNGKGAPTCDISQGLICDPIGKTCLKIKLAGVGAPCGYDATAKTVTACTNKGVCHKVKATDPGGTCIAGAKAGEACNDDENVGPKCLEPMKCVSAKCVAPDPASCK